MCYVNWFVRRSSSIRVITPSCCCCSTTTAAVEDSEEEDEEDDEECESPETGDCGGEDEVLLPWVKLFFLSLVKSAVMPGHSKWTQWKT